MKVTAKTHQVTASVVLIVGALLLIASFIVPPTGIIDNSVLAAFGEILTFVGAVWGIDNSTKRKIYEIDQKYEDIRRHNETAES